MRKTMLAPIAALLGGGVGFALRRWQLAAGFEPETGLAIPGAPSALALIACVALTAAAVLALSWNVSRTPEVGGAFSGAVGNTVYITAVAAAGVVMLAGAVLDLPTALGGLSAPGEGENLLARAAGRVLPPVRAALGALAAPCMLLWGRALYRGTDKAKENLGLLEICLLLSVWLITNYQKHSADPVTMNFVYEVLAIVCALLGAYYLAGYSFQTGRPRRCVFFCLMGSCFCLVTLADGHALPQLMLYGAMAVFLAAHAAVLLNHPSAPDGETEEESEAENHG